MTGIEETYLAAVVVAFAIFAWFVVRANNASDEYRRTH